MCAEMRLWLGGVIQIEAGCASARPAEEDSLGVEKEGLARFGGAGARLAVQVERWVQHLLQSCARPRTAQRRRLPLRARNQPMIELPCNAPSLDLRPALFFPRVARGIVLAISFCIVLVGLIPVSVSRLLGRLRWATERRRADAGVAQGVLVLHHLPPAAAASPAGVVLPGPRSRQAERGSSEAMVG